MQSKAGLRARIMADLLERHRLLAQAKAVRSKLQQLNVARQSFAAKVIAERHQLPLRRVNAIAASVCWADDESA